MTACCQDRMWAERMVTLECADGRKFVVNTQVACMSVTVRNILDDLKDQDPVVPLPTVTGVVMELIIEYCMYHNANPGQANLREDKYKLDSFCEWDIQFVEKIKRVDAKLFLLFHMIAAANYLDISDLYMTLLRTAGALLKGKTQEEICAIFSIPKPPTDEEKAKIMAENQWINDL